MIRVARDVHDEMVAHALEERPFECCGLLAGLPAGTVTHLYRLVNEAASPVEYLSEPQSLFAAHRAMRQLGIDILAIYHSHPSSEPVPSRTDLAENFYGPDVAHLIISLKDAEPAVRAWRLREKEFTEAEWEYTEE